MKKLRLEWILVAVGLSIRFGLAWTRARWDHPDEWYQTLEFGQILRGAVSGETWGIYFQEVDLHLRNLSLPGVFALLLAGVARLWPNSLHAPIFAAQVLSVVWSIGMVAALWRWARPHRWFPAALLAWCVLPFWAVENIKPSAENWAMHAFSWALFFLLGRTRVAWVASGFLLALTIAFKFPAALLVLGFAWGVWRSALHTFKWRAVIFGFGLGSIAAGIPDWIFYGLPWESALAYLQYNVLTPLGADAFGRQGLTVYLEYLTHHWLGLGLPLALWTARFLPKGLEHGFSRHAPWAAALALYTLGHVLIAHKEGRFLVPVEGLLIFAAGVGSSLTLHWSRGLKIAGGVLTLIGFLIAGKTWRGDWKSVNGSYFALAHLPAEHWRGICGVAVSRRMHSFLLPPIARRPDQGPAFAVLQAGDGSAQVIWDRPTHCIKGDQILLQARMPTPPAGCSLAHGLGPDWLACDAKSISQDHIESPYTRSIPRVTHYPRLGRAGIAELLSRKTKPQCTIAWCGSV